MKYILVLYLCSFMNTPKCDNGMIISQYNSWKECAVAGYEQSGINFAAYPDELVNKNKVAIRFECKEVGVI